MKRQDRNLLMAPPLRGTRVLGMDPGIRTGTKCAVMDGTGKYLASFVVYQERDPAGLGTTIAGAGRTHRGGPLAAEKRTALEARHGVGEATLNDILAELAKPNQAPRDEYPAPFLDQELVSFEALKEGMKVRGRVKNVVDFDAFVKDPMDVPKVGDAREFRGISLDRVRRRIGLLKSPERERSPTPRERRGPTPQASDTAYNPFVELLKKKRK